MISVLLVSGFATMGLISALLRKAPQGWEDENGFHFEAEAAEPRTAKPKSAPVPAHAFRPLVLAATK